MTVLITLNWFQHLSHEILHGALDYVADSGRTDIALRRIPWITEELQHACDEYQVEGLIVPVMSEPVYTAVSKTKWKCISTHIGMDWPGIHQIDADHYATGRMAADYFLNQGFDHFAFMGVSRITAMRMRRDGFVEKIEENGYPVKRYEFPVIMDYAENPGGPVAEWLKELPKPVAIYCSDDQVASDLIYQSKQLNLHVPDQIAVLGTEDSYELCRASHPDISSVHIPYWKIGYTAMEQLAVWLDGGAAPPEQTFIQPDYVAARTSTDTLAIHDPHLRKAVRMLRDQCTEKITMNEVARNAGVSLRVLQHKFKNHLGHSPLTELHRARIAKVKTLLRETAFSLEEIAERCGYPNANYLCEHFKKMVEDTPGEYRRKTQKILRQ